jgi:hypothetical protein
LKGDFYFAGKPALAANGVAIQTTALDDEDILWRAVEGSETTKDFEDYLGQFPVGRFAAAARVKIRQLKEKDSSFTSADFANLSVVTKPAGAAVYLNDRLLGKTPLVLNNMVPQRGALEMRLTGYRTWREDVVLRAGQVVKFNEALEEYRLASLDVTKLGANAEVLLNGIVSGKGGKMIEDIEPGFYSVEVREPGLRRWRDTVNLQPGEPWKLDLPSVRAFNVGIFPGILSGRYINFVDRNYGSLTSAQWAMLGVAEGVSKMAQFKVAFSHYDGLPVAKTEVKEIKDKTWKGMIFKELDTGFLRDKGKDLGLDVILLPKVEASGDTGPYTIYAFDVENDKTYQVRGIWGHGMLTRDVAGGTEEVLRRLLSQDPQFLVPK